MEKESLYIYDMVQREAISYINGFDIPDTACFNSTKQSDGVDCGVVPFYSGLINGKGRRYAEGTNEPVKRVPLEIFNVKRDGRYRFRVICASMTFGFRLSIDGHPLHVIATDGDEVASTTVESLAIFSGERFDFWIDATDPEGLGSYWIRAETMERFQNGKPILPHHVEAILQYNSSTPEEPDSVRQSCLEEEPCVVINCPFRSFGSAENLTCIPLTDLKSIDKRDQLKPSEPDDLVEFFLNFHYVLKAGKKWQPTINGIQHDPPTAPPQIYPDATSQSMNPCGGIGCDSSYCFCTHKLEVPLGKLVQMVLVITIRNIHNDVLNGMSHSVHLHGHQFQVLKIGYPSYHAHNNFYAHHSADFSCEDDEGLCNKVRWTNSSWNGGNVPGLVEDGAPWKDTVSIPVGGYVVVRFRATNLGFWYGHCHTEFHNEEGMAFYMQVGDVADMNPAPRNMHTCGSFQFGEQEFLNLLNNQTDDPQPSDFDILCERSVALLQWMVFGLICITMTTVFVAVTMGCKYREKNCQQGYTAIPQT